MHRLHAIAWFAATLALGGALRADVIHLKSGQKVEGKITKQDADAIEVDTKFGAVRFERVKIDRIEFQRVPKEELEARVREAGNDAGKLYAAALYAKEQKLGDQHKKLLERVVEIEPQHPLANEALGRVQYDGQWFTPDALARYKVVVEEKMKAEGKVFYRGAWMEEKYAYRLQGKELYHGQWLPWKEIYTLQAKENMQELLGVELEIRTSEHFALRSQLPAEDQQEILDLLETGFQEFTSVFQPDAVEENVMEFYPIAVYVLPGSDLVLKFIEPNGYMERLYNPPKGITERYLDATSFPIFFPRPLIVTSEGRHLKGSDSRKTSLFGFLSQFTGNVLVRRFKRGGKVPGWVEAGLSSYYEARLNGYQTLTLTEYTGYEHVQVWEMGFQNFPEWYEKASKPEIRAKLPTYAGLQGRPVEELAALDLVKSYFLVTWLMETRPAEFAEFVRLAYKQDKKTNVAVTEEEAFDAIFKTTPAAFEAEFAAWAEKIPPRPPL